MRANPRSFRNFLRRAYWFANQNKPQVIFGWIRELFPSILEVPLEHISLLIYAQNGGLAAELGYCPEVSLLFLVVKTIFSTATTKELPLFPSETRLWQSLIYLQQVLRF